MKVLDNPAFLPVAGALLAGTLTTVLVYKTRAEPTMQPKDMGLMALGTVLGAAAGWGIQRERGQNALPAGA